MHLVIAVTRGGSGMCHLLQEGLVEGGFTAVLLCRSLAAFNGSQSSLKGPKQFYLKTPCLCVCFFLLWMDQELKADSRHCWGDLQGHSLMLPS